MASEMETPKSRGSHITASDPTVRNSAAVPMRPACFSVGVRSAGFFHSIELVTMVVVGGMASTYGAVLGAAILTILPQLLSRFEGFETMVFGAILMLSIIFLPRGLLPTLAAVLRRSRA